MNRIEIGQTCGDVHQRQATQSERQTQPTQPCPPGKPKQAEGHSEIAPQAQHTVLEPYRQRVTVQVIQRRNDFRARLLPQFFDPGLSLTLTYANGPTIIKTSAA